LQSTSSEQHECAAPVTAMRAPRTAALRAALESLRPYQWLKNVLVFVPLAAAHRLAELDRLGAASRAFLAFCLCASAIYLLNDILDADADRRHPHKRLRPIASGRLGQRAALALAGLLLLVGASVAFPLGVPVVGTLVLYVVVMIAYSLRLKAIVLLDAFVLAGGYALRVIAGGLAVQILPSARLLAFCAFLFVSLALVKRYAELALLGAYHGPATHARSYGFEDREVVMTIGVASGVLSVLVLALFLIEGHAELHYSRSQLIWATCVLLLYWISHVWLAAHRGRMTDDPLVFALKDRVSIVLIASMGITAWLSV
jgi:4-hydroxybenzoate polyprenyltransferase